MDSPIVEGRIKVYDLSGYDVLSLMNYSGTPWLSVSWLEVRYPPEDWLSAGLLASLQSIEVFLPNGEQSAFGHFTTPFLLQYIEAWDPSRGSPPIRQPYQYATFQQGIDLAHAYGGMVFIAHPVGTWPPGQQRFDGMEIFNASFFDDYFRGEVDTDENLEMVAHWDISLATNPRMLAISANDWCGPWRNPPSAYTATSNTPALAPEVLDSGKTVVLSHTATLPDIRDAVERGAMLAVRDVGPIKGRYPRVDQIAVGLDSIWIVTDGDVRWIGNGAEIAVGSSLDLSDVPDDVSYVRAEISNAEGSVTYTQAFALSVASGASRPSQRPSEQAPPPSTSHGGGHIPGLPVQANVPQVRH